MGEILGGCAAGAAERWATDHSAATSGAYEHGSNCASGSGLAAAAIYERSAGGAGWAQYVVSEDFDAVVLKNFIHVEIDQSGRMKQTTRMVTHVLRLQGIASVRQVNIGWIASRENRLKIKGRVITPGGKAHVLEDAGHKTIAQVVKGDDEFLVLDLVS